MKCHIEPEWSTGAYKVWLYSEAPEGLRVLQNVSGDTWREEVVPREALLPEPTFTLPRQWLEVFAKEAAKIPTADDATTSHLKDAREVRDRLLRIVEHKMGVTS